jgi:hypothetical protein
MLALLILLSIWLWLVAVQGQVLINPETVVAVLAAC